MPISVLTDDASLLPKEFFKKSHALVFSQLDMSPVEQDLFALFLSKLEKDDWREFLDAETLEVSRVPEYTFTNRVLSDWFDVDVRDLQKVLAKPAKRLADCSVGVRDDRANYFKFNPLFSEIEYRNGKLTITPNHKLFREFLCLSQGHSQIPHREFRLLKREYSKRLFTMLCRFKREGTRLHPMTLDEIRAFFGLLDLNGQLKKKTYAQTKFLMERIIKPAISEINEVVKGIEFIRDKRNPNYFGYLPVYEGRRIVAIDFNFRWLGESSKFEFEPTYENAVITHYRIEMGEVRFTQIEIDNLKSHWFDMLDDESINTGDEIKEKLKNVVIVK